MTTQAKELFALFDSLAAQIPALDDSNTSQEAYDQSMQMIPALMSVDPFHPLARLLVREIERLEALTNITPGMTPAFDIPGIADR